MYGENGRGVVHELGLQDEMFARLHTFGKALASNGGKRYIFHITIKGFFINLYILLAAILGSDVLRQYLINYARPLIYSTFMSYSSLASIKCAYDILESGDTVSVSLLKNVTCKMSREN